MIMMPHSWPSHRFIAAGHRQARLLAPHRLTEKTKPPSSGSEAAGRVGFFLHVEDFDAAYARMASAGVRFLTAPRTGPYGQVAVFLDIAGNKWDLIGPAA